MSKRLVAVVSAAVILVVPACESGEPSGDDGFPVREPAASPTTSSGPVIGLVGTMSGQQRWRGSEAFEGLQPAIHILNRDAGESQLPFTIVGHDDDGDPERALELIEELAASERTVGIVYAGPPEALPRAEGILGEAGIPAILLHGDLYSARLLRPHLFQSSPPYLWQSRRLAPYLWRDRRYRRVGALVESSLTGKTATESLRAALRDEGGRLAVVAEYPDEPESFAAQLDRLERRRVEAIVFEGSPLAAALLFEQLTERDATYVSTDEARTVTARGRRRRNRKDQWRPQIAGFDSMISPLSAGEAGVPAGTVAADTYARGAYYLPVESFERFETAFLDWWDQVPVGWQQRAYEAALAIGWAYRRTEPGEDVAETLESLSGERFGGLEVTFGPDDHTATIQTTVGLWVVPRAGLDVRERDDLPEGMPWVPLSRGFTTGGTRTDVLPTDWEALFFGRYRPDGPAPRVGKARFGVATTRRDPVH